MTTEETEETPRDPVSVLIGDLQRIRRRNGMPSFTELARRTGYPRSTLHDALRGDRLPACDLVVAVAEACGEPGPEWKERWIAASAPRDHRRPATSGERPADVPDPPSGRPGRFGARRISLATAVAAAATAAVAGAGVALVAEPAGPCSPAREYRVDRAGAVLDAAGAPIGEVLTADQVEVRNLGHDRYPHRYFGTVARTGLSGYVDEAKLTFTATTCVS